MTSIVEVYGERLSNNGRRRAALYLRHFDGPRQGHAPTDDLKTGGRHAGITLVTDPARAMPFTDARALADSLALLRHLGYSPRVVPAPPADPDHPAPAHAPATAPKPGKPDRPRGPYTALS